MNKCKVLIVGTPRSGTHFITKLLRRHSLFIRHESLGKEGACDWQGTFKCRYWYKTTTFEHTLHQVRHPLKAINSLHTISPWRQIAAYIPISLETEDKLLWTMKTWYYWNLEGERISELTYKVEDILDNNLITLYCDMFNLKSSEEAVKKTKGTYATRVTHYKYGTNTWNDLFNASPEYTEKIITLATKYGYDLTEEMKGII